MTDMPPVVRRHRQLANVADHIAAEHDFGTIEQYWRDPAPFEAERESERAKCHALIDAAIAKAREARALDKKGIDRE